MSITVIITDNAAAQPPQTVAPVETSSFQNAGASPALLPINEDGTDVHSDMQGHAINGGAPPGWFVQEIEAALDSRGDVGMRPEASASPRSDLNAGGAPQG